MLHMSGLLRMDASLWTDRMFQNSDAVTEVKAMLGTGETGEKRFSESQSCRKRRHDEVAPE